MSDIPALGPASHSLGSSMAFMATTIYYVVFILIFIRIAISLMASFMPVRGVTGRHSGSFFSFVMDITEPLLKPFRIIIPIGNFGIDFSPFALMYILNLVHAIIVNILS